MTLARPRIGVTRGQRTPCQETELYLERLRQAGAEPVALAPGSVPPPAAFLRQFQGLLLSGGPDVDWQLYADRRHPETEEADLARDEMELALLEAALEGDLPVLAICRGHQVLNVALGGRLLQHIEGDGHRARPSGPSAWNRAVAPAGTRLAGLLGAGQPFPINCRHHQVVGEGGVARDLLVAARAEDGGVEALEGRRQRWLLGVQWHPERAETGDAFVALFTDFVRATAQCHPERSEGSILRLDSSSA